MREIDKVKCSFPRRPLVCRMLLLSLIELQSRVEGGRRSDFPISALSGKLRMQPKKGPIGQGGLSGLG